jgi:hypothetical protein
MPCPSQTNLIILTIFGEELVTYDAISDQTIRRRKMTDELKVVECNGLIEVLSQYSPQGTDGNHEKN